MTSAILIVQGLVEIGVPGFAQPAVPGHPGSHPESEPAKRGKK